MDYRVHYINLDHLGICRSQEYLTVTDEYLAGLTFEVYSGWLQSFTYGNSLILF